MLLERLPRTLYLMFGGLLFSLVLAIPAGLLAAAKKARAPDLAVTAGSLVLMSVPEFWTGTLLVLLFSVKLRLLPTSGYVPPTEDFVGFLRHAILPMISVGALFAGITTRTVRSSMIEELKQDYVTLARAEGIPFWRILWVHCFRNALVPTLTLVGLQVGILLGGAVIVEKVFAYPGMGLLLVSALSQRDYPVIQGGLLLFGGSFILVNVIVDIIALVLDPRRRNVTAEST